MKMMLSVLAVAVVATACGSSENPSDVGNGADSNDQDSTVVNGPATITDDARGLMWQARPDESWVLWDVANAYCDGLELEGYSDWRLPTIDELRTLIVGCPGSMASGACQVVGGCNDSCYTTDCEGCSGFGGPGPDGCYMDARWGDSCPYLWSGSTYIGGSAFSPVTLAWYVQFEMGWVWSGHVSDNHMVARCVRTITQ